MKNIQTLSCWYSLESSRGALSDEYPFAGVSVISQVFCIIFVSEKLATSSILGLILLGYIWSRSVESRIEVGRSCQDRAAILIGHSHV